MARTEEGLLRSRRALPRPVWWLFAGSFVNRFGSFVSVFLVLYLVERGYSAPEAGAVAAAYGVGGLGAAVIGGFLADRIGRRNAIALSMFTAAGHGPGAVAGAWAPDAVDAHRPVRADQRPVPAGVGGAAQ